MSPRLCPGQFFGVVLKERKVADSILTEYTYPPDARITRHSHALPYFSIILHGVYDERCGSKIRECKPSMLLFHPEGEEHADRFRGDPCRIFSFELATQWLDRAGQCSLALNQPVAFPSGSAVWLAARLYGELYATDAASPLVVEGLLLEIMAAVARDVPAGARNKPPGWLCRAKEFVCTNFSEFTSLNALAAMVGVHPIHLSREFRRYYDEGIGEYVRRHRIEFAAREMAASDRPLLEIAIAAGFADHGHFTRTFKRLTGLTPTQYRATFTSR